jgi:hypothetical protein
MLVTIDKNPSHPINMRKWANSRYAYLLICFFAIILSGCVTLSDPESSQIHNLDVVAVVTPTQYIGQSFISRRPNMNGLILWIKPNAINETITFELFNSTRDKEPRYRRHISAQEITPDGNIEIPLTGISNPPHQAFYIRLGTDKGEVEVLGRNEDSYPEGRAYINNQPVEGDIAFRTSYDYDISLIIQDILGTKKHFGTIAPIIILLLLPGWFLLRLLGVDQNIEFSEKVALSVGLSLALVPLLMLWTSTLKLRWSTPAVWVVGGIGLFLMILRVSRWVYRNQKSGNWFKDKHTLSFNILLTVVFGFALFVRLAMVRDLVAPPWVDSVHHGLITRLILENGAYPETYTPYLPEEAIIYHNGYHSILASFIWLSGLDIPDAMLLLGQILNAVSIFSVYLFTITLTKNRYAGLFAALIAGFMTPMPTYFTSWGRYTHLAGLLILPAGLRSIKHNLVEKKSNPFLLISIIVIAGLSLVHYRVLIFLILLTTSLIFFRHNSEELPTHNGLVRSIFRLIFAGFGGLLLVLPWWLPRIQNMIIPTVKDLGAESVPAFHDFAWGILTSAFGFQAMAFAGLGVLLGMIRRKKFVYALVLWIGLMFGVANFSALGIPLPTYINNTSVEISLYMPISVLGGYAIYQVMNAWQISLPVRRGLALRRIFVFGICILSLLAVKQLLPILNPVTFLFRQADDEAITWVGNNLPPEETILINPTDWGYGLYMGSDGGYWISALTEHATIPPPVLYGFGEQEYVEDINQGIRDFMATKEDIPKLWDLMLSKDIKYIYLGSRGGVFSTNSLSDSERFRNLYNKNGVQIFEALEDEISNKTD